MSISLQDTSLVVSPSTTQGDKGPRPEEPTSHIDAFFDKAADKLKTYESQLQEKFAVTSNSGNALMRMPEYMVREFDRLEAAARTPEERAVFERFKKGVTETFEANRDHMISQINSKIDSTQMKIGAQFVTKAVQGIQQLLTAT